MKTASAGLKVHLASGDHAIAKCLKLTLTDSTVIAATTHDLDIVFDGVTYKAKAGGTMSDVEGSDALNVVNGEFKGLLNLESITEEDLHAGLYDFAAFSLFEVNWRDLTQGKLSVQDGWLGEISNERNTFSTELRGLKQALSRTQGHLATPICSARLGDSRCTKDISGDTVTGTLDDVNPDNVTLYDAARGEPGPAGGISITAISNANPGVVTTATALTVPDGSSITLSGITGTAALNGVTIVRNKSGLTFELGVDTSDTAVYPAYTGGGVVTPAGAQSGWFDYGVFTATSGLANGLSMEVKSYVPGQITLQLPMPRLLAAGDTYSMTVGCNKTIATCFGKFANSNNFQGRPYVPGQDKIVQVGRHT